MDVYIFYHHSCPYPAPHMPHQSSGKRPNKQQHRKSREDTEVSLYSNNYQIRTTLICWIYPICRYLIIKMKARMTEFSALIDLTIDGVGVGHKIIRFWFRFSNSMVIPCDHMHLTYIIGFICYVFSANLILQQFLSFLQEGNRRDEIQI